MKRLAILILFLAVTPILGQVLGGLATVSEAQQTWAHAYGGAGADTASKIRPTHDGGFILVGATRSFGAVVGDPWLWRLDSTGNVQWQKRLPFPDLGDYQPKIDDVQETSDGGFIAAGTVQGQHSYEPWVLRFDNLGRVIWQASYRGLGWGWATAVRQASDGGFIVAGRQDPSVPSKGYFWLAKLTATGEIAWQFQNEPGGSFQSWAYGIVELDDGTFAAAGTDRGMYGLWNQARVVRVSASGQAIWCRSYEMGLQTGGSGACIGSAQFYSVAKLTSGRLLLAGSTSCEGNAGTSPWLAMLDTNGNLLWQAQFGTFGSGRASDAAPTPDGGGIVAGYTNNTSGSSAWLIKLDANGNSEWQENFGSGSSASSVCPAQGGGYGVAGGTTAFGAGSADALVLKLSTP